MATQTVEVLTDDDSVGRAGDRFQIDDGNPLLQEALDQGLVRIFTPPQPQPPAVQPICLPGSVLPAVAGLVLPAGASGFVGVTIEGGHFYVPVYAAPEV